MISTKKRLSVRPTDPRTVAEVYVGWCPRSMGTHRRERLTRHWRWDVTFYTTEKRESLVPPLNGGFSSRIHLGADFGYTLTERGAWRLVRRSIRSHPRQVG